PRRDALQILQGGRRIRWTLLHLGGQAAAGYELDDHVWRPLVLAVVEDVEDVGVTHLCDGLRLAAEAGDRVRIGRDPVHHLDRSGARQGHVVSAIDDAHGALTYEVLDLILPQPCAWFYRHER